MNSSPRRRRIIVPRLLQLLLATSLLTAIVLLWQQQRLQVASLQERQGKHTVEQLLDHASHSAAVALRSDDLELLQWLVDNLVSEPEVVAASVFSYQGKQLASAQKLFPEDQLPDELTLQQALQHFTPHTIAVRHQQQSFGYLRVRINTTLLQQEGRRLHQQLSQQLIGLLLCSGIIGFILARALSFKRARVSWLRLRARRMKKKRAA